MDISFISGMANIGAIAAIGTAFLWAMTPLISVTPSAHLGSIGFSRWRMYTAFTVLAIVVSLSGKWVSLSMGHLEALGWSGFVGIFLGDTLLFASMNILGPRRAAILFASNAAIAALMAVVLLDDYISPMLGLAFALVTLGVMLAIFYGRNKASTHLWETNQGSVGLGILFGLAAALCQAYGSILAKPVMDSGADPMAASAVRLGAAALAHTVLFWVMPKTTKNKQPLNWRILLQVTMSSVLSMVLGMTLLLFALANADVSLVSILSSISPILILPVLWVFFGKAPPLGAWAGAALTVIGTTLIILNESRF